MEIVTAIWIIGMFYTMGQIVSVATEDRPVGAEWLLFIGMLVLCVPFWPVLLGMRDS